MANKIQLKRGLKSRLSTLSSGEPAFTTDTRELFVGTGSGNINMSGNKWYNGTELNGVNTSMTYTYSACPLVKLGDMYLNTSTGNVYECTTSGSGTTAKWTYKGCIRGPMGSGDTILTSHSTNPVQNKVIVDAFAKDECFEAAIITQVLALNMTDAQKTAMKNIMKARYEFPDHYSLTNGTLSMYAWGDLFPTDDGTGYSYPNSKILYINLSSYNSSLRIDGLTRIYDSDADQTLQIVDYGTNTGHTLWNGDAMLVCISPTKCELLYVW